MQIITTHVGCDFDGLASLVAAQKLHPGAKISFSGNLAQEVRDFIHLYGQLLSAVKVEEEDLHKIKKLILVDTRLVARIGIFGKLVGKKGIKIYIYDHHPSTPEDIKGDGGLCKEVGATTSILVELIRKRKIPITPFEATLFTLGIYEDTGSLRFSSTTHLDLESVAFLLKKGANLEIVSGFLNRNLNEKQNNLLRDFLEKAKVKSINGVEVVIIVTEIDDFVGGLSLPLHKFIDLKNTDVTFAVIRARDKIYVLARSRDPSINVSEILSPLGGGGHEFAASALIKNRPIEEVEKALQEILKRKIRPRLLVKEVMRSPVPVVFPDMSAAEVKKIMKEHSMDIVPVQEKDKIVGSISREKVENIISYHSSRVPIRSFLSWKFISISSNLSLKKAQEVMIQKETPWLFVFREEKLIGVISSLDIFKALNRGFSPFPEENVKELLQKRVPPKIMRILFEAGKIASEMRFPIFIVGGFVRDLILGNENLDIDLVVEGDGIGYAKKLAKRLKVPVALYEDFGTATLNLAEGFKLDVATSRSEFYPRPAALPRVKPAPLKEDLFRRDFTVNAMAISINPSDFGKLIDFFGGKRDLERRKVRVLHPRSFIDDPTRIFRAIRFEQRYRFSLDEVTERLLKQALNNKVFRYLSGKRLKEELVQLLEEERPEKCVRRMHQLGILQEIHPKISLNSYREKILSRLVDAIAFYEVLTGTKIRKWLIRLSVLMGKCQKEEIADFCKTYHFTREEKETLNLATNQVKKILRKLKLAHLKPSSLYYFLKDYPPDILILAMAKTEDNTVKKRIALYFTRLSKVELEIDGNDLKRMGYKPSPQFSKILEETKKAKLDGLIKTREEEIEFVRKNFSPGVDK